MRTQFRTSVLSFLLRVYGLALQVRHSTFVTLRCSVKVVPLIIPLFTVKMLLIDSI